MAALTGDAPRSRPHWRKSSRSNGGQDSCVEVASLRGGIGVRDSKNPQGQSLAFEPGEWATFLSRIKLDELDL